MVAAAACTPPAEHPRPLTAGPNFFDRPFPEESRWTNGHPDLHDFPLLEEVPLLQRYVEQAPNLDGFGLASPIWVQFDAALDSAALPTAYTSTTDESVVYLLDVDPDSPERGRRIPISTVFEANATRWTPANLLSIQPVWGMPLRPGTRYAVVLTTDIAAPPQDWAPLTDPTVADREQYQALLDTLLQLHLPAESVAYAFHFRTQDPAREMALIAHRMATGLSPSAIETTVKLESRNSTFQRYTGHVRVPIWQHGDEPYTAVGGAFAFDPSGWPELWRMAEVEFSLTVPRRSSPPDEGWPVVLYAHGTGGDRTSFASDGGDDEPASVFADIDAVGFGISLPFHGDRYAGSEVELVSFNYLNPDSGRTAFRQAALEQVWLAQRLAAGDGLFVTEDGDEIATSADHIAYMGHSHGAEIGIMALPFFGDTVQGSVLSSGGGGLTIALLERDAGDFDIQGILREVLLLEDDESLTSTHPAIGLVQMIAEATDPLHYARYWFREAPYWEAAPQHVLVFQGLEDLYTPPSTIGALAGAAGLPILAPVQQEWEAQQFSAASGGKTPAEDNVEAWTGASVTAGLLQYPEQGHFAVFRDPEAIAAYRDFLHSVLSGEPRIDRPTE